MSGGRTIRIIRRARSVTLLAVVVSCVFATWAAASGSNTIKVVAPKTAKVGGHKFNIALKGHAKAPDWVYLWVGQVAPCKATPAGEHKHYSGYVWQKIKGNYDLVTKGWRATRAGTFNICAYLAKGSQPENSAKGVLARSFAKIKAS